MPYRAFSFAEAPSKQGLLSAEVSAFVSRYARFYMQKIRLSVGTSAFRRNERADLLKQAHISAAIGSFIRQNDINKEG